jgi:flagellar motor switch protein FliM
LSTWLRIDFTMQLAQLDTMLFGEFTAALPAPTHITLFKLEPLRGVCVAEVRSGLALSVVDRLLGGPGHAAATERNLTEMEVALMDQCVQMILDEWCKQWTPLQEMRAEILGHENNPRFLQSSSGDSVMLIVALDARMGDCEGKIQLAFPYATIEPVVNKAIRGAQVTAAAAPAVPPAAPKPPKWNSNLDQVPLTVTARWPSFKVPTRELLALKPGETLELPPEGAEQIELRIGAVTKLKGRLGTHNGKWAVQIREICKT